MEVFIVTKQGVYRHEIMGVFQDLEFAKNVAIDCIKAEHDDYHDFHVIQFDVGAPTKSDGTLKYIIERKQDLREGCNYVIVCKNEAAILAGYRDMY